MASLSDNDKKIDMDAPAIPYNVAPCPPSLPPASNSPKGTDIPVSRPSPFGASFAGPSHNIAYLDLTHEQPQSSASYHRTHTSASIPSSSSSVSCGSNRHAMRAAHNDERKATKALEKSVKHEAKLLAKEESQLAKTAKREAKALGKEVEQHAKVISKELKYQAKETVASMKRSLRDKLYDCEQQLQHYQEKHQLEHQQHQYRNSGRNGCSRSSHKRLPWPPTQPAMDPTAPPPPQIPHAVAPLHIPPPPPAPLSIPTLPHSYNSHHVSKQQRKLDKHLSREQRRVQKIEYKQQRKVDRLVNRDYRRHRHLHSDSFPMRILGSVLSKSLDLLKENSSSQHPPQQAITAPAPPARAPEPLPPRGSYSSSSSSPSCPRSQPKRIGPQEPVLVYAMSHMSLNPPSAPSAPALPPHHEPAAVTMAVPRPDLEIYLHGHDDDDEDSSIPPPSYEAATARV
ncbi:hypothetical protein BGZ74_004572 [Mortierella antarctica]|nr:hypothetical protein BGZ74_004572 [Mortierella antarctica]